MAPGPAARSLRRTNTDRTNELFRSRGLTDRAAATCLVLTRASAPVSGEPALPSRPGTLLSRRLRHPALAWADGDLRRGRAADGHRAGRGRVGGRYRWGPGCPGGRRAEAPAPGPIRWRAPARPARAAGRAARPGTYATARLARGQRGPRPAS